MQSSNIFWTLPFFSFITGYYVLHLIYAVPEIDTPCILGKQLPEAAKLLSDHNLNARLMAEKEDTDLPNYTIVSQTPTAHTKVKPHQSVFLVITRHPETRSTPYMIGKSIDTITEQLDTDHIRHKYYWISTHHPTGTCIAQHPQPKEPLNDNFMIIYLSSGNKKPSIWPDFRGRTIQDAVTFLEEHEYTPQIIYNTQKKNEACIITEQRPIAGSIIDIHTQTKPCIQLYVG